MQKNKNEMAYWLIFILILITISIYIILYFRLPKSLDYIQEEKKVTQDTIIVN